MKCFQNNDSGKLLCNLIIFGLGSLLTLLGVVVGIFIYRTIKKRNRTFRENSDEPNLVDNIELSNLLQNVFMDIKSEQVRESMTRKLSENYESKLISNEGDEVTNNENITGESSDGKKLSNDNWDLEIYANADKKSEGDDTYNKFRLSDIIVSPDLDKFRQSWSNRLSKLSTGSSVETSYATIFIDDASIDSVERKRIILGVELPVSNTETNIFKTNSVSEPVNFHRSPSIRNSITLYDSNREVIQRFPVGMNLATHVIPSSQSLESPKLILENRSSSIETISKEKPLKGVTQTRTNNSRVNLFSLPRRFSIPLNQQRAGTHLGNLNTKTTPSSNHLTNNQNTNSLTSFESNKNPVESNISSYSSPSPLTVISANKLHSYVPQFVISNCVNSLLHK